MSNMGKKISWQKEKGRPKNTIKQVIGERWTNNQTTEERNTKYRKIELNNKK